MPCYAMLYYTRIYYTVLYYTIPFLSFTEADCLPCHQVHQFLVTASEVLEDDSGSLYESLMSSISNPLERIRAFVTQVEGGALDSPASKKEIVSHYSLNLHEITN